MEIKKNANIVYDAFCRDCGWPVIDCNCNDEMQNLHPEYDWWWYCSNQGCKNHTGAGYDPNSGDPEWVFRINQQEKNNMEKGIKTVGDLINELKTYDLDREIFLCDADTNELLKINFGTDEYTDKDNNDQPGEILFIWSSYADDDRIIDKRRKHG